MSTIYFTDLDYYSEQIIFESFFTSCNSRVWNFKAAGAVAKIGSSLKLNHYKQI
jgi:hypothetical protein